MMLASVGGAQSNLNLAVGNTAGNPLTIAQKDLKMAYVPKRKNNNNNIRFKRLTSQSNHENKLQKLQQSTMMLQNFNSNALNNQSSSRDSLPLQPQMSVASAQFLPKNNQ